jgi:hypothetical protein
MDSELPCMLEGDKTAKIMNGKPQSKKSFGERKLGGVMIMKSVTVAERSKACTVSARSEAGIVGSNPTQGMMFGVCVCALFSVFMYR